MLCFNSTWQKLGIEAMVEDPNNVEAVVIFPKVIEYVLLDDETISDVDDEAAATTSNREANGDGGYPIVVVVDVDDDIMVQTRKMAYLLFTCFHQTARNFPIAMFECFGLCFHDVPLSSCCLSLFATLYQVLHRQTQQQSLSLYYYYYYYACIRPHPLSIEIQAEDAN